jgi:hypothetical protein
MEMEQITVSDLRERVKKDLDLARVKVQTLEDMLKLLDNAINEGPNSINTNGDSGNKEPSLLAPVGSNGKNTYRKAIRELMENAPGEFNVPGIVRAIERDFPTIDRAELSKTGSQVANKLSKSKKIKLVQKGGGREPNIYISAKYSSK